MNPESLERKEIVGLHRITKKCLRALCKKHQLYQTPELNEVLYLHYQGFQYIECLEEYTELKCLWLECNAISEIQGLENQTKLKCLFLQNNLIKNIENLEHCKQLDTLNLASNHIRKIENCGIDILPVLNTLNLSSNCLRDSESLRGLEECKTLSVLDLANNRIDDILVVKVFAKMPQLRVLVLQGNPVVSKIPQYRKTLILECKELTYLDSRPVFPKDRACAEAWKRGGYNEERKEQERWNRRERKKIRDSVNATIRMRNKHKPIAEQLDLITSSDSETDEKRRKEAKERRANEKDPRLLLETGENLDDDDDEETLLDIWNEVSGPNGAVKKVENEEEPSVESSIQNLVTEEATTLNKSIEVPILVEPRETLEVSERVKIADILNMVDANSNENINEELPDLVNDADININRKRPLIEEIGAEPETIPKKIAQEKCMNMGASNAGKKLIIEEVNSLNYQKATSLETENDEVVDLRAENSDVKKPLWVDEIFTTASQETSLEETKETLLSDSIADEIERETKQGAIKKHRVGFERTYSLSKFDEISEPAEKWKSTDNFDIEFEKLRAKEKAFEFSLIDEIFNEKQIEEKEIEELITPSQLTLADDITDEVDLEEETLLTSRRSISLKSIDEYDVNMAENEKRTRYSDFIENDLETKEKLYEKQPLLIEEIFDTPIKNLNAVKDVEDVVNVPFSKTFIDNPLKLSMDAEKFDSNSNENSPKMNSLKSKELQMNPASDSESELSNASDDFPTDTSSESDEPTFDKKTTPDSTTSVMVEPKKIDCSYSYKPSSSESEDESSKLEYNAAANAICDAVMSRVGEHEQPKPEKPIYASISVSNDISTDNYEPELEIEKMLERLPSDEAEERAKRFEPNDKITNEPIAKTAEEIKYAAECEEVNQQVEKDFEALNANMEYLIEQFQHEKQQIIGEPNTQEEEALEVQQTELTVFEKNIQTEEVIFEERKADADIQLSIVYEESSTTIETPKVETTAVENVELLNACGDHVGIGNDSGKLPFLELEQVLQRPTLKAYEQEAVELKALLQKLELQNEKLTTVQKSCNKLLIGEQETNSSTSDDENSESFHDAEDNFEDNNQCVNAIITEIIDTVVQQELEKGIDWKPKNYIITDMESDEEYSYTGPPKPEEPPVKSIRSVLGAFNNFMQEIARKNREERQAEYKSFETKRVPTTQAAKLESLQTLLETPSLLEHHKNSYEQLKPQVDAIKERNTVELKQMVERVYAQKDKYNDSLEVMDGRLVVIKKETGEVEEITTHQKQNENDADENTDEESADDYETANSSGNEDEEGEKKTKNLIWDFSMGAATVKPHTWTPKYRPSMRKTAKQLILNALESNKTNLNLNEGENSDDDDEQALLENKSSTSVFSNIDEDFFKNLNLKEIAKESIQDENFVEIARSYEELRKIIKKDGMESARSNTTDEEKDILNKLATGDTELESAENLIAKDEDILMHKLVQRAKEAKERGEDLVQTEIEANDKPYILKAEIENNNIDSDQETIVSETASNNTLIFDLEPAKTFQQIKVVKMLKKLQIDDPIAQNILQEKNAKKDFDGDFTAPLELNFEKLTLENEDEEETLKAAYTQKFMENVKTKSAKQTKVECIEMATQCEPKNFEELTKPTERKLELKVSQNLIDESKVAAQKYAIQECAIQTDMEGTTMDADVVSSNKDVNVDETIEYEI